MRPVILSRLVAVAGSLAAIIACNDALSPNPSGRGQGGESVPGITIVPQTATIHAGQIVTLEAELVDEFGDRVKGGFSWKSSDDAIATVASGVVYGRSQGYVSVTASAMGRSQSSTIHVLSREPKTIKGGKPLL